MKKTITALLSFILIQVLSNAQDIKSKEDSILTDSYQKIIHELNTARQDTSRVLALADFADYYKFDRPDSALFYGYKSLALARQIKFTSGELFAIAYISIAYSTLGDNSKALQMTLQALRIADENNVALANPWFVGYLGTLYEGVQNYNRALELHLKAKSLWKPQNDSAFLALYENNIGGTYLMLNQLDSALYHCQSAYQMATTLLNADWVVSLASLNLGNIYVKQGNFDSAFIYFRQSEANANNITFAFNALLATAQSWQKMNRPDSALFFANKSMKLVSESRLYSSIVQANILLSEIYEKNDPQRALQYSKAAIAYKDSLYNLGQATSLEAFTSYDEQQRQYEIQQAQQELQSRLRTNTFLGITFTLLIIAVFLFITIKRKQNAKQKIEQAYGELKTTQAQLIQSEKMASLGELTAGIAHEIQNPLNFVNNFSEVSNELIDEMKEELGKGDIEEAKSIASDIQQNLEKITHHGKRAEAIVKGMLQHSRSSSGVKELTDINALADEYLRLSYHGLRAKDKSFNATMKTDFDETIGNINIISQEIGRVLLNLYNNAFYAVAEKKKQQIEGYEPTISVSTKKANGKIEISVSDNGNGIPQKIVDKIFQPFFTTKPTGQGTGLGLSLSYDIAKAHGGEIRVESKEGEGTEFSIVLPA